MRRDFLIIFACERHTKIFVMKYSMRDAIYDVQILISNYSLMMLIFLLKETVNLN